MQCLNAWVEEERRFLIDGGEQYLRDKSDLAALAGTLTKTDVFTDEIRKILGHSLKVLPVL